MRKELDKKLCEKYPLIFKNRYGNPQETLMCFGFEHGDGWYNIIDVLCGMLYNDYENAKSKYEKTLQWKEEFGHYPWKDGKEITPEILEELRLKMVEQEQMVPVASQIKEKFGTLRFYTERYTKEHDKLIHFAEALSARTCEICGNPGRIRGRSWMYTACDEHTEEDDLNNETESDRLI